MIIRDNKTMGVGREFSKGVKPVKTTSKFDLPRKGKTVIYGGLKDQTKKILQARSGQLPSCPPPSSADAHEQNVMYYCYQ